MPKLVSPPLLPDPTSDPRQRILLAAREHFFAYGYSALTMDGLAAELGMSKKTLYKYFPSKDSLLQEIMSRRTGEIEEGVDRILREESLDFVEKVFQKIQDKTVLLAGRESYGRIRAKSTRGTAVALRWNSRECRLLVVNSSAHAGR